MRKQLEVDIKANTNKDLATVFKDLMEKYNTLLAKIDADRVLINALLAQLDADAGVTDTDYVANHTVDVDYASTHEIDID